MTQPTATLEQDPARNAHGQDHAPLLERAFALDVVEDAYEIAGVRGEIPAYLNGSYYLNGPSAFGRGGLAYRHWLDGDGMVSALHFAGGKARFVNRFVRSAKFVAEQEAGRSLYRAFGTAFEGDRLKRGIGLESPVNVSVFTWRGTLLAFGEQGLPWELDPETLETRGEHTFGGRLNAVSPLSAHPCFDRERGEMFNFGISFAARQPCLHLYRFAADGELAWRRRLALPYPCSVHDFIVSPRYVAFYLSPYLLDVEAVMRGGKTIMEALSWEPERGSRLLVASRETGEEVASVPLGRRFCLHLVNAFEEDGRLVVDVVELDRPIYDQYQVIPDLFLDAPRGRPRRRVIDAERWEVVSEDEIDYSAAPDFPAIDPRRALKPYDDLWLLGISKTGTPGRKFFDQIAHVSWRRPSGPDVYQAAPRHYFGGEPVFLGDPGDAGAGVVICQDFDAEAVASSFLIFDAYDVAAGPVATLPLKHPVPLCFHASWEPRG